MATVKTYDSKCFALAALFLSDEPGLNNEACRHSLALEIQQCIEDEIYFMRNAPDLYGKPSVGAPGVYLADGTKYKVQPGSVRHPFYEEPEET